jgi:hypothetical protein
MTISQSMISHQEIYYLAVENKIALGRMAYALIISSVVFLFLIGIINLVLLIFRRLNYSLTNSTKYISFCWVSFFNPTYNLKTI